jgi:hypothetical protein
MYKDSPYRAVNTLRFSYNKTGNVRADVTSRRVRATTVAVEKH